MDAALSKEIVAVVQPAAVEAALMARQQAAQGCDDVLAVLQRDLEAAQYATFPVGMDLNMDLNTGISS